MNHPTCINCGRKRKLPNKSLCPECQHDLETHEGSYADAM